MRSKINSKVFKILWCIIFLVICQFSVYPWMVFNESESAFEATYQQSIGVNIVESAGFLLKSQSEFLYFLNLIEVSEINGVDYAELQSIIEKTMYQIEKARESYWFLVRSATNAEYSHDIYKKLKQFNYSKFQKRKGLHQFIFSKVEEYLKYGDVLGLYQKLQLNLEVLQNNLGKIKKSVDKEKFPKISKLWRINQMYYETMLIGQYTAEVFSHIGDNVQ